MCWEEKIVGEKGGMRCFAARMSLSQEFRDLPMELRDSDVNIYLGSVTVRMQIIYGCGVLVVCERSISIPCTPFLGNNTNIQEAG
jgi:hypothetical protein